MFSVPVINKIYLECRVALYFIYLDFHKNNHCATKRRENVIICVISACVFLLIWRVFFRFNLPWMINFSHFFKNVENQFISFLIILYKSRVCPQPGSLLKCREFRLKTHTLFDNPLLVSVSSYLIMNKMRWKVSAVVSLLKYINPVDLNTLTFLVRKWYIADTKCNRHEIFFPVCFDYDSTVYNNPGNRECGDYFHKEK